MLTIKDDSLRYYTISYAIFNQLSYLINSSGQILSVCLTVGMCVCVVGGCVCVYVCLCVGQVCVCVSGGWGAITPVMGKRRRTNLKYRTLKRHKIEKQEGWMKQRDG